MISTPSVVILHLICKIIQATQIIGDGPAKDILVEAFAYISVFILK